MLGVTLLVLAAVFVTWRVWPRRHVHVTDSRNIRTPEADAQVRDVLWDVPAPRDEILRLTDGSTDYALDADARRLVFVRGDGASADILLRERSGNAWGAAEPIEAINSADADLDVSISPDGDAIVFSSDRPGAVGGYDLYISRYSSGAWGAPAAIANANSAFDELGSAVMAHGTRLAFASNRRSAAEPATGDARTEIADDSATTKDFDLFEIDLIADAPAEPIASANSAADELDAAVSPAGDFLYFASNRSAGTGGFDLYRLRVLRDGFGALEHLDGTINTAADETDPVLGLSGFRLTYRSVSESDEAPRLLQSTSREVYRDVTFERGTIDWAGLLQQIAPNLLWALLALILTLLFLAMMRDFRDRKIGLMARCLLASLLAHLVMMLLFNVLKVSTEIASAIGGRDRIRIALTSEASAGEIGEQIRGEFVNVETVAADVADAERPALEAQAIETQANVEMSPRATEAPTDAPSDSALTRVDAQDSKSEPAMADVSLASELPELAQSMTPTSFDDVALPQPAAAESRTESPVPAGIALVGETELESANAPMQQPTTQPAGAMSIDVGVAANVDAPSEGARIAEKLDAADATSDGRAADVIVTMAAGSDLSSAPIAVDVALPGESTNAPSGDAEPGVRVAGVDVNDPAHAALSMPVGAQGGTIVEMPVAGAGAVTDEAPKSIAHVSRDAESDGIHMPGMAAEHAASMDEPVPGIEVVIALPGEADVESADAAFGNPTRESFAVAIPDDPASTRGLPSANEALAASQSGVTTLVTLAPDSDTGWVTVDSTRSTGDAVASDSEASPIAEGGSIVDDSDVPIVQIALGVGIPVAPPRRPAGIRRGAIGRIVGTVEDAETGMGLGEARILLAMPNDTSISVKADAYGSYEIQVPEVPDHFALSASRGGYIPESRNIEAKRVRGRTITVNFALSRQTELVIALEDEPDVHHLGNDRFEGRINSQFQKQTEGRTHRATFEVSRDQLPPNFSRAEVVFMVKGVQCPHQVRINGRLVRERLRDSPRDGSFGEYRSSFDPGWLLEGRNQFRIRARSCGGDLDDFEFVNVQIRLLP